MIILYSKRRSLPAEIVCNPQIMGGVPAARGCLLTALETHGREDLAYREARLPVT